MHSNPAEATAIPCRSSHLDVKLCFSLSPKPSIRQRRHQEAPSLDGEQEGPQHSTWDAETLCICFLRANDLLSQTWGCCPLYIRLALNSLHSTGWIQVYHSPLSQYPECWDHRHSSPCPSQTIKSCVQTWYQYRLIPYLKRIASCRHRSHKPHLEV